MKRRTFGWPAALLATLLCAGLTGCGSSRSTPYASHEDLDATLWMQTSAEYAAAAEQAFRVAREQLEVARNDPKWSALPAQQEYLDARPDDAPPLPPAVIIDVDETLLDNSPYQASVVQQNYEFDPEQWEAWVTQASARAIPGAATFLEVCRESGVTVFFVTNRTVDTEKDTRRNMESVGLLSEDAPDTILSKYERDAWTTDKSTRRDFISKRYRVLLLVGDDLNDFVWAGDKPSAAARRELTDQYGSMWGRKWIILPNANYGGWERSLYEFNDTLPRHEKLRRKRESLEPPPRALGDPSDDR